MIIKTVQTLVFEYPEDYQAEIEWNKKRDGDWVHQSRDTMCSVYTLTNNYLIPTKAKHSFLDNPYFEAEPRTEEPSFTATDFGKGTITRYTDEPQTESLEQFRVGLEYHTDTTHFGKVKGESITTNKVETMSCQECKHYEVGKPCKPFLNECDCHYEPKTENE